MYVMYVQPVHHIYHAVYYVLFKLAVVYYYIYIYIQVTGVNAYSGATYSGAGCRHAELPMCGLQLSVC